VKDKKKWGDGGSYCRECNPPLQTVQYPSATPEKTHILRSVHIHREKVSMEITNRKVRYGPEARGRQLRRFWGEGKNDVRDAGRRWNFSCLEGVDSHHRNRGDSKKNGTVGRSQRVLPGSTQGKKTMLKKKERTQLS